MIRGWSSGLALVTLLLSLAESLQNKEDNLQGTWKSVEAEMSGGKLPEAAFSSWRLELTKGKYVLRGAESPDAGTVVADSSKKPKTMDITGTDGPNKGKTYLAIYELEGDSLRICYDLSGKKRPGEFKSLKDTPLFLVTYKREK
jgi:uncharacterized protein (TIGR03067 family)